jgi:hypothetical protein
MSLFVLHRSHGMHVFNRLPGFFSSQVDLLGSRPVKTQSYVIHDDDDDDDDDDNDDDDDDHRTTPRLCIDAACKNCVPLASSLWRCS